MVMSESTGQIVELQPGDALLMVDVQNDFLPGGRLPVPHGDEVSRPLNAYIRRFAAAGIPILASRDWHPPDHCSFRKRGGRWPVHCVAGSEGAQFPPGLRVPSNARIISKAITSDRDCYSAFDHTKLAEELHELGVGRLFVGGLATEYCVRVTVEDALRNGFDVILLTDAIRAINIEPGDGDRAIQRMVQAGAVPIQLEELKG
jgi:nicotinamidase-related amidase